MSVFKNGALRRVSGPKKDEVERGWRKVNSEELHSLRSLPDTVKVTGPRWMKREGSVMSKSNIRNVYKVLVGQPGKKKPLERPRRR